MWTYGPACRQINLSADEAAGYLRSVGDRGYGMDEHANEHGIRRAACVVVDSRGMPVGVLALAQCDLPGLTAQVDRNLSMLLREATQLQAETSAKIHED